MSLEKLAEELEDVQLAKKQKKKDDNSGLANKEELMSKAVKFTNEVRRQYGDLIKSVLVFGSIVRGEMKKGSDVDMWVILDDTATKSSEDLDKVQSHLHLVAHELKDLHVQTTNITEFWQWVKIGSPELVNFLRYGLAIYDTGFVKPVQRMLNMGMIPPSEEAIALKARASDIRYRKIKADIKSMIFELRYTAMDMIQAAVMCHYKAQPDFKGAVEYLEKFVKEKKLEKIYLENFKQLDSLWKSIDHKEIKEVTTDHLDKALHLTKGLIERFKKLIPKDIIGEDLPEED